MGDIGWIGCTCTPTLVVHILEAQTPVHIRPAAQGQMELSMEPEPRRNMAHGAPAYVLALVSTPLICEYACSSRLCLVMMLALAYHWSARSRWGIGKGSNAGWGDNWV